jgi:hypothetical protein
VQAPEQSPPGQPADRQPAPETAGFQSRGRARRRARFLRKARELAYRDLGGLVFNLHRFGQRNDELVLAKLTTLGHIDAELRAIEDALEERRPLTVLREAGITACARCAAIHSSEDSFCPNCGLSMARNVDLPIAGAPAAASAPMPAPTANVQQTQAPATPQPAQPAAPTPPAQPPTHAPAQPAPNAPAPQRASQPAAPFAAPSGPGRSPVPPVAPAGTPSTQTPPSQPSATPSVDDMATEIIHPPAPGS